MCKLKGINFGYADSERELMETPELFDEAFVDPRNYLTDLLNGMKFLILGRKGSGKTAYSAKIRRMATNDSEIIACPCSLSNFDYLSFEENFSNNNVQGGRRFLGAWKYLLLIEIVRIIFDAIPNQENIELQKIYDTLREYAILPSEDIIHMVQNIQKRGASINLGNIFGVHGENEEEVKIAPPEAIAETIIQVLKKCHFGSKKFYLIIDGLDDVLRSKHFCSDVITGLIRASEELNKGLHYSTINMKIIILLRTDIYELCRDPDLNKIKRDLSINLTWGKDDLKKVVFERVSKKYSSYENFDDFGQGFVPAIYRPARYSKVNGKDKTTEEVLFEITLFRPRDILQFFIECQEQYGEKDRLTYPQLVQVINGYSQNYFVAEMKDELTGFLNDDTVNSIPMIFSELGKRVFKEDDPAIVSAAQNYGVDVHKLLEVMFLAGYVGQLRVRKGKTRLSFRHFNPYDNYSAKDQCIIHRGLTKAFNVT